jgi:hypothetical protein
LKEGGRDDLVQRRLSRYPLAPRPAVLRVDAGGHADFRTIGAAVDYAATHPAPQPERIGLPGGAWWIIAEPGSYWERPFTLPAHTYLIGTGFDPRNDTSPRVVIGFGDDSQGDMITFSRGSCLAHLAVYFRVLSASVHDSR